MSTFRASHALPVDAATAYAWHAHPGALERLLPPFAGVRLLGAGGGIGDGARTELSVPLLGPLRARWVARHEPPQPGSSFCDVQERGPFAAWRHVHRFVPTAVGCTLEDEVEYALPGGALGGALAGGLVARDLARGFAWRQRRTAFDLEHLARGTGRPPLTVAITGAGGMVAGQLRPFLTSGGHRVISLRRGAARHGDEAAWDPATGRIDDAALDACDAVVHLAGANVARRWTAAGKALIRDSRVDPTRALCSALAARAKRPRVLICASGVGYYGDRGDDEVDEQASPGGDFLADVCRGWEDACEPARQAGIRVVNLRIGVVLSPLGGALAKLLPPFRCGGGGRVGSGRQVMSWISLDDLVYALHHALISADLSGPVNATAPAPASNAVLTATLARVLHRPHLLPLPAWAVGALFGEMGRTLLLTGVRAVPRRLQESGFRFADPDLEAALRTMLGR